MSLFVRFRFLWHFVLDFNENLGCCMVWSFVCCELGSKRSAASLSPLPSLLPWPSRHPHTLLTSFVEKYTRSKTHIRLKRTLFNKTVQGSTDNTIWKSAQRQYRQYNMKKCTRAVQTIQYEKVNNWKKNLCAPDYFHYQFLSLMGLICTVKLKANSWKCCTFLLFFFNL